MWNFPPLFGANIILASALQFVNVTILENATKDVVVSPGALPFVEYRRHLSVISEGYAAFTCGKARFPDAKVYMQAIP